MKREYRRREWGEWVSQSFPKFVHEGDVATACTILDVLEVPRMPAGMSIHVPMNREWRNRYVWRGKDLQLEEEDLWSHTIQKVQHVDIISVPYNKDEPVDSCINVGGYTYERNDTYMHTHRPYKEREDACMTGISLSLGIAVRWMELASHGSCREYRTTLHTKISYDV